LGYRENKYCGLLLRERTVEKKFTALEIDKNKDKKIKN
jgi:hypothetical protein